jgi:competence protein ComEA
MTIRVWLAMVVCVAIAGWGEAREASGPGVRQERLLLSQEKASTVKTAPGAGSGAASGEAGLVNVNSASAEQLEALPGIGAAMAARIIEYRQKHGPFKRLDELMNVRGIGEKNFLKLKPLITVAAGKGEHGSGSEP